MFSVISQTNHVEESKKFAKQCEAALQEHFPGGKVEHAQLGGKENLRRFEVAIPNKPVFAVEFGVLEPTITEQSASFMKKVRQHLRGSGQEV